MYDRKTESWWQQFGGQALVGCLTGSRLKQLPARIVSWREFRAAHPDGDVLTRETGYDRDYGRNPYAGYDDAKSPPFFPISRTDGRLPPKARVVFVERGASSVAVPFSTLRRGPAGSSSRVTTWSSARAARRPRRSTRRRFRRTVGLLDRRHRARPAGAVRHALLVRGRRVPAARRPRRLVERASCR